MYICVPDLIKQNIENKTAFGEKLAAERKERDIICSQIDHPTEYWYSSAHFDLMTVLDLVSENIRDKRGN